MLVSSLLCGLWSRNQGVALLAIADVLAIGSFTNTHPGWLLAVRANELDIGDMQCRFDLDDAGLPGSSSLDVLLDDIDAVDDDPVPIDHIDAHLALLAFVPTRCHQDKVATSNLSHPLTLPLFFCTRA